MVGQLLQWSVPTVRILDSRKAAPTNHLDTRIGPQYLWEPIPGCKSESFKVATLVDHKTPTKRSILAYKRKIGKEHDGGNWGLQFQPVMRGWRSELPVPRVEYNRRVVQVRVTERRLVLSDGQNIEYDLLLNTIPLPAFLGLIDVPPLVHFPFRTDPIYMHRESGTHASVNGMILNYISDPAVNIYRETWIQGKVYHETLDPKLQLPHADCLTINPGKIHAHPESERIV